MSRSPRHIVTAQMSTLAEIGFASCFSASGQLKTKVLRIAGALLRRASRTLRQKEWSQTIPRRDAHCSNVFALSWISRSPITTVKRLKNDMPSSPSTPSPTLLLEMIAGTRDA